MRAQLCLTLCDSMDSTGFSVHGIVQARILPFPPPGDLLKATSPAFATLTCGFFTAEPRGKPREKS